MKTKTKTE